MSDEWYNDLKQRYPELLEHLYHFECDSGWKNILDKLFLNLVRHEAHFINQQDYVRVHITQVKEKFGGLRVYLDGGHIDYEPIQEYAQFVCEAELESFQTCEFCGSKENVSRRNSTGYWIYTSCKECCEKKQ